MVKVQPHKKIVVQSDFKAQHASTVAKQTVLPSRDPRTVCMTEGELSYLLASFGPIGGPRGREGASGTAHWQVRVTSPLTLGYI